MKNTEILLEYIRGPLSWGYDAEKLSSSAAKWVEVQLGLARENDKVRGWLLANGGQPTPKAVAALEHVRTCTEEAMLAKLTPFRAWRKAAADAENAAAAARDAEVDANREWLSVHAPEVLAMYDEAADQWVACNSDGEDCLRPLASASERRAARAADRAADRFGRAKKAALAALVKAGRKAVL